jgi:tetratricopeptide (TPR) repeat protein
LVRETYSKKEVAQFLAKGFVPLKIDAEKGKGPELAKRYGVNGFPTLVIVDPKGEEVDRLIGYRPPQKFLAELQPIVEGKSFGALKKRAETDLDAAVALGKKYEERSDFAKAAEVYGRVLKSSSASAGLREAAEGRMAIVGYYQSKGKEIGGVEKFFRDHAKSDGARDQARVVFGHYQGAKGGEPAKVIEAGDYLIAHGSKEDSEFLNNYAWYLATHDQKLERALELAKEAVRLSPKSAHILDTLAEAYSRNGLLKEAVDTQKRAVECAAERDQAQFKTRLGRFAVALEKSGASKAKQN